jgi:hypothetical protein
MARFSFWLLNALPRDPHLPFWGVGGRADDDRLFAVGFERDARGTAFDHDALGAQERDQFGRVPILLQLRDVLLDAGVPAGEGVQLGATRSWRWLLACPGPADASGPGAPLP